MNKKLNTLSLGIALTLFSLLLTTPSLSDAAPTVETVGGIEFVFIKGGKFVMGDILHKDRDASPPHRVTVKDFWIGKYEVTFEQYDAFCKATKRKLPDDNGWVRSTRPVINVSWQDATEFTKWLSEKSGRNVRLPSESQWEYAARAGTTTPYWWGNQKEKNMANCFDCGSEWDKNKTAPVGSFKHNPWGLHDMHGNINEWVFDKAHEGYENAPETDEPWLENGLNYRIVRGGSYRFGIGNMKAHFRDWYAEDSTTTDTGFRVVILD